MGTMRETGPDGGVLAGSRDANGTGRCEAGGSADDCGGAAGGSKAGRRFFMYVAECSDGSWYTGYTTDVDARIKAHNAGCGARYTRLRGPVRPLAVAEFGSRHEAMSAEWHFKRLDRSEKERLVLSVAPGRPFSDVLREGLGMGAPPDGA